MRAKNALRSSKSSFIGHDKTVPRSVIRLPVLVETVRDPSTIKFVGVKNDRGLRKTRPNVQQRVPEHLTIKNRCVRWRGMKKAGANLHRILFHYQSIS